MSLGGTDFHTVNQMTYQGEQGDGRAEILVQKPELVVQNRVQFNGKSQTQADYAGKSAPARTRAVIPAQPTIDLRFDNRYRNVMIGVLGHDSAL